MRIICCYRMKALRTRYDYVPVGSPDPTVAYRQVRGPGGHNGLKNHYLVAMVENNLLLSDEGTLHVL